MPRPRSRTRGADLRTAAVAGRRIDAAGASDARFPPSAVSAVRSRLLDTLRTLQVEAIVCSGACGADLLAIDAAREIGAAVHLVLPFAAARFRQTSVADCGGDWGAKFDSALADAAAVEHLTVLPGPFGSDAEAFTAVTRELIRRARALGGADAVALAIWDERSGGPDDFTAEFVRFARAEGVPVTPVPTRKSPA